jgi:hypothetical protein
VARPVCTVGQAWLADDDDLLGDLNAQADPA